MPGGNMSWEMSEGIMCYTLLVTEEPYLGPICWFNRNIVNAKKAKV